MFGFFYKFITTNEEEKNIVSDETLFSFSSRDLYKLKIFTYTII